MANNQKIDNVSIKISVESIQELVVGSSISPIRLEKRLPLLSMPAHQPGDPVLELPPDAF